MSHWHMQPWDGKDSLHLFCGSLALALLLDPALPRAAPPGGRLQAGLGPGLLWVRSGFSPLRGDAAQPPLHHPGRLAHTPAYLHMCTNHKYIAKFCRHIYQYYLLSTHFLCCRGSQDCVTWHGGVYCDSRQPRPATPVFRTIFHNFYLEWIHSGLEWIHSA